ncbi:uncharacterized protein EI97DRAFT_10146 [Westerdykella ornata]|uniref:Uncharacterized protein n=1 Tax=Westerdykella ornata TaxID=318751 RepID=A0A6A6JXA4_WESOR|nr:uncharacterized protein EI97DRAFT_10146 [Westerdykella ornata]KAF2280855.1 hypothetical protein EI97DRAFT_10146 [Westerdykella ornata]
MPNAGTKQEQCLKPILVFPHPLFLSLVREKVSKTSDIVAVVGPRPCSGSQSYRIRRRSSSLSQTSAWHHDSLWPHDPTCGLLRLHLPQSRCRGTWPGFPSSQRRRVPASDRLLPLVETKSTSITGWQVDSALADPTRFPQSQMLSNFAALSRRISITRARCITKPLVQHLATLNNN